ncbi:MAG: hypothetical protein ACRDZ8_01165 [Acidimicrobiales bacterium]
MDDRPLALLVQVSRSNKLEGAGLSGRSVEHRAQYPSECWVTPSSFLNPAGK